MSWSVSYAGDSTEATKQVQTQFEALDKYLCPEPEETIKQQARTLIAAALAGNVPSRNITVSAYGSQSTWTDGAEGSPTKVGNMLSINIT